MLNSFRFPAWKTNEIQELKEFKFDLGIIYKFRDKSHYIATYHHTAALAHVHTTLLDVSERNVRLA